MIVYVFLLVCGTGLTLATDCPDGWLAFKGSCYLFGTNNVHFTEAENYCRDQHEFQSRLVHVETSEENMFLKGYMGDHLKVRDYWLGMTDELTEGRWKWYGGETVGPYFDWNPGEPQDAHSGEDCAIFHHKFHFRWADTSCTSSRSALCELR
ncbi:perlucin-like protein [Mercenaria mercenaria]|uniref:perlucin-like protein n=1 Tax=Mercenaria mercenaria TaxID=6596 RepID=UPI00234E698C|nr:perlucin-like protein [Mercenaria mercenaria]